MSEVTELNVFKLNELDWTGEWEAGVRSLLNLGKVTLDSLRRVPETETTDLHGFSRDNGKRA